MLCKNAEACDPNNVNPFAFKCADIWAGPVSFATTNELVFIKDDSCEISRALPLSNMHKALIFFASSISSFLALQQSCNQHYIFPELN